MSIQYTTANKEFIKNVENNNIEAVTQALEGVDEGILSNKTISDAFKSAYDHSYEEIMSILLRFAGKKISEESVSRAFTGFCSSLDDKTKMISQILKYAATQLSNQVMLQGLEYVIVTGYEKSVSQILKYLPKSDFNNEKVSEEFLLVLKEDSFGSNGKIVLQILNDASERLSKHAILEGFDYVLKIILPFHSELEKNAVEAVSKILETRSDIILNEVILKTFLFASEKGYVKIISHILNYAGEDLSNDVISEGFKLAAKFGHVKIVSYMLKTMSKSISKDTISEAYELAVSKGWIEVVLELSSFTKSDLSDETIKEITLNIYKTHNGKALNSLVKSGLFNKGENVKLILFNNFAGEWSNHVIDYIISNKNCYVISGNKGLSEDKNFLSIFDGFVNPGADDTFANSYSYSYGGVDVSYLDDGRSHMDNEYAYQYVIDYAQKHNVPYLGICNGAQHLILHNQGYVARTDTNHNRGANSHFLNVKTGSIIHFLVMKDHEQSLAITEGYFSEITFPINTQHKSAGVTGKIGNLELGGLSEEAVIEAVSRNMYQNGLQFHSEYLAHERDRILLDNIFKFFKIDKDNLMKFNDYITKEWYKSYDNAKCYDQICPAQTSMARNIFTEACVIYNDDSCIPPVISQKSTASTSVLDGITDILQNVCEYFSMC